MHKTKKEELVMLFTLQLTRQEANAVSRSIPLGCNEDDTAPLNWVKNRLFKMLDANCSLMTASMEDPNE